MNNSIQKHLGQSQEDRSHRQPKQKHEYLTQIQELQKNQDDSNSSHQCLIPKCKINHESVSWFQSDCKNFDEKFHKISFEQALKFTKSQIEANIQPIYSHILENLDQIIQIYERGTQCLQKKLQEKEVDSWLKNFIYLNALDKERYSQEKKNIEREIHDQTQKLQNKFYKKVFDEIDYLQKQKYQTNGFNSFQPQDLSEFKSRIQLESQKKEFLQFQAVVQECLTNEEQTEYEYKNPILKTIIGNICTDYEGSYTKQNLKNVLSLYLKVYEKPSFWERNSAYEREKTQLKKYCFNHGKTYFNEMKILEWIQNKRGIKFDGSIIPGAKNELAQINFEKPDTCTISKNLVKSLKLQTAEPQPFQGRGMPLRIKIYSKAKTYEAVDKFVDVRIKILKFEYFLKPMSRIKDGQTFSDTQQTFQQIRNKRIEHRMFFILYFLLKNFLEIPKQNKWSQGLRKIFDFNRIFCLFLDDKTTFQLTKKLIDLDKYKRWENREQTEKAQNELKQPFYDILEKQKQFFNSNCLWLFKKNLRNKQQSETGWVVDFDPKFSRYFWRANKKIDKYDVENLLCFILAKNSSYSDCPSIVINAGSHGDEKGIDAYTNKNKFQVDPSILYEMQYIIHNLMQDIQKGEFDSYLTKQNISQKIFINEVQRHRGGIYPVVADHVIDSYCHGAYSMIKKDLIDDYKYSNVDKNILFLSSENNLFVPSMLWYSTVIINKEEEEQLVKLFDQVGKINSFTLLYRQSVFVHSGEDGHKKFLNETDTILICRTFNNRVMGAYTPIAHRSKSTNQSSAKGGYRGDQSGKSFIFTLSQDEKFRKLKIVDQKEQSAICLNTVSPMDICFGSSDFQIYTRSESWNVHFNINRCAYFNQKYESLSQQKRNIEFCGESTDLCTCKDWEVWKVNFHQSEDKSTNTQSNLLKQQIFYHKKI